MRFSAWLALGLFEIARMCAADRPVIASDGVMNAASHLPVSVPGGAIARGARFIIQGAGFGASEKMTTVRAGAAQARVLSTSERRIEAWMPLDAPLGGAPLTVTVDGAISEPSTVRIVRTAFGAFSQNGAGWGPGRIQNLEGSARTLNSMGNSARPGQTVILEGTGLSSATAPRVLVAGKPARVVFARPGAGGPGLDEVGFETPPAPLGCFVPVVVIPQDGPVGNIVTMSIADRGGQCVHPPAYPFPGWLDSRVGLTLLSRTIYHQPDSSEEVLDELTAAFGWVRQGQQGPRFAMAPPPGACTTYVSTDPYESNASVSLLNPLFGNPDGEGLDAGPAVTVNDRKTLRRAGETAGVPGYYHSFLGWSPGFRTGQRPLLLNPGSFAVTVSGGKAVGAFRLNLPAPAPFVWSNRSITEVDRTRGVTLEWVGAPRDHFMVIMAASGEQVYPGSAQGVCYCMAPAGPGRFTIAPEFLANLPVAKDGDGGLLLMSWPAASLQPIRASGLDHGFGASVFVQSKTVRYR